eukprot:5137176-Pyramimonas_sp.AAC.1
MLNHSAHATASLAEICKASRIHKMVDPHFCQEEASSLGVGQGAGPDRQIRHVGLRWALPHLEPHLRSAGSGTGWRRRGEEEEDEHQGNKSTMKTQRREEGEGPRA